MSVLKSIESLSRDAAKVLKEEGLRSDWDIQTLTREDLNELFPGRTNFKLRRTIYELIHKQEPIDVIMREVKGFIPHEFVRDALTENGVLVDYLRLLKDLRGQMNEVQGFLDAHIRLLEGFRKNQPGSVSDPGTSASVPTDDKQQDKRGSVSDPGTSDSVPTDDKQQDKRGSVSDPGTSDSDSMQTDDQQQDKQGEPFTMLPGQEATVKYRTVVSGKTLDADKQLMEKVKKSQRQDGVQFVESSDDYEVNILFCPISSRIGSDIDAAMSDVKDDKPVILVLMHHERLPRYVPAGTWTSKHKNVVMHVSVYYHDTVPGLITCRENDTAISSIQNQLLVYSHLACQDTSGNAQGVGAESGRNGSTSFNGGGGCDRRSDDDSSSGSFSAIIKKKFNWNQ